MLSCSKEENSVSKNKKQLNNNVAIIFDDLTEFFVMRDAIDDMKKAKIDVDVIVPYDSGYNGLPEHTFKEIKKLGYCPLKDAPKNKEYKILLTPYPTLHIINRIKYIYHLRYPYGAISAKPTPVFTPEWKIDYDGIFTFNLYEPKFLDAYGTKYHIMPYWRYKNFKKEHNKRLKPNLLILPTFGADTSCIKLFKKSAIKDIKEHYNVISKAHHATHFNSDKDDSFLILKELSDEFYDSNIQLDSLLEKADIVLSDNSGAIFEAIYTNIPVALFCKNPNQRKLKRINTLQYDLVQQKILPHTNQAENVLPMLQNIQPYIKKQANIKNQLFPSFEKNSVHPFTETIKEYLSLDPNNDYRKIIHDQLIDKIKNDKISIDILNKKVNLLESQLSEQSQIINDLYNSTSWKITSPLRKIKQIINNGGSKNEKE